MRKWLTVLLALPKSIYINFKCFNFRTACRMPVVVSNRVCLKGIRKGSFIIDGEHIKPGMIRLGIADGSFKRGEYSKSLLSLGADSHICVSGGYILPTILPSI